jgi:hypothetical protein
VIPVTPGVASVAPISIVNDIDAIDVSRAGRYLYVVVAGVGVNVYDNQDPSAATLVATVPIPTAVRAVPWGIHLFVVDIGDHGYPAIAGSVGGISAVDVTLCAHYQSGPAFDVCAYVANPGHGLRIVDLLPDFSEPTLVGTVGLPGAVGLDTYTRYVSATKTTPSREHDYLYVAAGAAGLHVVDITDPDNVFEVAVIDLGGDATAHGSGRDHSRSTYETLHDAVEDSISRQLPRSRRGTPWTATKPGRP